VLRLNPHADPIPTEHVVIIQHANGGPKQIALSANAVLQVKPPWLHYSTDTLPGSSGSPVFNDLWQVIAVHHAEGPELKRPDGYCYSNEGVLASAIKPDLGKDWPA
jgi:endonuclease G, mitochondrial